MLAPSASPSEQLRFEQMGLYNRTTTTMRDNNSIVKLVFIGSNHLETPLGTKSWRFRRPDDECLAGGSGLSHTALKDPPVVHKKPTFHRSFDLPTVEGPHETVNNIGIYDTTTITLNIGVVRWEYI